MKVGVAIITHDAHEHLTYCLPPLINSPLKPRLLLINSSSTDGTIELAKQFGVETLQIPRAPFNHGLVRELARKKLATDIVVMLTPDAYARNKDVLGILVKPLLTGVAACAYARQLPRPGASFWEAFPRYYNYPSASQLRSIDDTAHFGTYTFFFSNSFGAYLNTALDEIGGFSPVLTGEDTLACAQLLHKGYKVAYVAEAEVYHSHNYSLKQEFKRYFDTGLARTEYGDVFKCCGKDSKRGREFVYALIQQLKEERKFYLIPYALIHSFTKWIGYSLGKNSRLYPKWLKKRLSAQKFYW